MLDRTPEALLCVAGLLDAPNNFAFLPHRRLLPVAPGTVANPIFVDGNQYQATPQLTLCNAYATVFCACFGAELPPIKANDQFTWLKSGEAQMKGWLQITDRDIARQRVNLGSLIVIVAQNLAGHGHIGVGVPNLLLPNVLHVSAAGAQNYACVELSRSFGSLSGSALCFEHTSATVQS